MRGNRLISYNKFTPALIACTMASLMSGCDNTSAKKTDSMIKGNYPLQVALHSMGESFQEDAYNLSAIQHINSGESPTKAVVTIEVSELPDDSVSAEKTVFTMSYQNDRWQIVNQVKTQRCWPGRGHTDFSEQPCN